MNIPSSRYNVALDNNEPLMLNLNTSGEVHAAVSQGGNQGFPNGRLQSICVDRWAILPGSVMINGYPGFFLSSDLHLSPAHRTRPGTWMRSRTGLSQLARPAAPRWLPLLASFVWDPSLIFSLDLHFPPQLLCSAPLLLHSAQTLLPSPQARLRQCVLVRQLRWPKF